MARIPANMAPGGGYGAAPPSAQAQMQAHGMNMRGRQVLLQTGVPMCKIVQQGQQLTLGQAQRINLFRSGITTGVLLDFTCSLNITAGMTASLAGPWALIDHIEYVDFDGTKHVDCSGMELWLLNTLRHGELLGNSIAGTVAGIGSIDTDILAFPTAIANPALLQFSLWIPLAVDQTSDLRGAIPSMVNVGDHYINITPAASLTSATDQLGAPYSAGTAAINANGFTVDVTQYYIQPQSVAPQDLPEKDLTTIYELKGKLDTTSGLISNGNVFINYPNDRAIMSAIFAYENAGVLTVNGADLNKVKLIVNSNTTLRENTPRSLRQIMRSITGGDVPSGVYYFSHRQHNILTALYATVQAEFDLGTVNAGNVTKIRSFYESTYPSGRPLTGISPNG